MVDAFRDHQQRRVSGASTISAGLLMSAAAAATPNAPEGGAGAEACGTDAAARFRRRVSADIMNVLEREPYWDFDVIQLERVTQHHPLASLGAKVCFLDRLKIFILKKF